ncbi:S-layer family protein, partial [Formosimonas limnophila]|uniref:S-layer family protein n=1 Tax=Formosimonas limnophila TaxID=1384487 RepID=UPI001676EF61
AFLSSDYMLKQLATDPNNIWKRLGDGFYEQKLINDQIITATGKRFTGDYTNNEAQYKALMTNGIAAGKAFGFNVGTALTPEQMKNLTTDIVWMVKQTVTLKDGTTQTVLVPKVYLATNTLDLKGDGTLIAARHNWLDSTGDINNNGGVIAGTSSMDITARNVNNRGGVIGGNKGGTVSVRATDTLNNIGGTIR